jgi:hypothetical protein
MDVNLEVNWKSQRDNARNPSGSCNVTSIAMALAHFGYNPERGDRQLEDYLYDVCDARGLSRHEAKDLKALVEWAGFEDAYNPAASLADIRAALDDGKVCVIHAFSTNFGHIFVIDGYSDRFFNCQDPWGEWHPWFYTRNGGKDEKYSDRMIGACAGSWSYGQAQDLYDDPKFDPNSVKSIWLHVIGPKRTAKGRGTL